MGKEENSRQREKHRQSPGSSGEHSQGKVWEDGGEVREKPGELEVAGGAGKAGVS